MKKIFIVSVVLMHQIGFSQEKKKQEPVPASSVSSPVAVDFFAMHMNAYKTAVKYFDLQAAATALYSAMAVKPERTDLLDSLTYLYFAAERYGQVYLLGEDILKRDEKRNDIREMVAIAKQSLNMTKEALADYERLYADSKELQYLYQAATLQYQLKRYGECLVSLDQIIKNSESSNKQISIKNQDGSSQNVPMKAAALNVKGICAMEVNQDEEAKANFNEALKVFPDFILAKNNLNYLLQAKNQSSPNTPSSPQKSASGAATTPKR
jgi:tetratricopeptide (TPR) repeat protein